MRRLNVGCGRDIRPAAEGWVNMDLLPMPGVDVAHDMLAFPWPFPDGHFDHVLAQHVLEHVPHRIDGSGRDGFLLFLEEVHRVLAPRGTFEAVVPHWEHESYWRDPTHTRTVHPGNFFYLTPESHENFYTAARFRVERTEHLAPPRGLLGGRVRGPWLRAAARVGLAAPPQELRVVLRRLPRDPAWKAP